jgi:hypothetical protein
MTYNLPTPYHEVDKEIQDRVNKIPQECPLCHMHVTMQLNYSQDRYYDLYPTINYTLQGHCRMCRIKWEFSITTD